MRARTKHGARHDATTSVWMKTDAHAPAVGAAVRAAVGAAVSIMTVAEDVMVGTAILVHVESTAAALVLNLEVKPVLAVEATRRVRLPDSAEAVEVSVKPVNTSYATERVERRLELVMRTSSEVIELVLRPSAMASLNASCTWSLNWDDVRARETVIAISNSPCTVGDKGGTTVGAAVGATVGVAVGAVVGAAVGFVGAAVGAAVLSSRQTRNPER